MTIGFLLENLSLGKKKRKGISEKVSPCMLFFTSAFSSKQSMYKVVNFQVASPKLLQSSIQVNHYVIFMEQKCKPEIYLHKNSL